MSGAVKERPILFSAPMVRAILDGRKTQTRRMVKLPHENPLGVWEPGRVGGGKCFLTDGSLAPELTCISHSRTGDTLVWGAVGTRLWVRETWKPRDMPSCSPLFYRADDKYAPSNTPWVPGIYMPRWASRITLEVTEVRVERLQAISEADATAEGVAWGPAERHGDHDPRWIAGRCRDCAHWNTNLAPNGGKRIGCPYHYSDATDPDPSYGDAGQGCSHGFKLATGEDERVAFQFQHFWKRLHFDPGTTWDANPWVWVVGFRRLP